MNAMKLAEVFTVLSVGTRVRIVQLLKEHSLCVNALAMRLEVTPAAVSQHLRVLRAADLVMAEKRGYYVHYRLNEKTLAAWREEIDRLLVPASGTSGDRKGDGPCAAMKRKAVRSRKT